MNDQASPESGVSAVNTGVTPKPAKHLVKVLPTDRVSFDKQMSALRAYAAASGQDKKAVTNDEVAAVMSELVASSISLCNPFFADIGLLIPEGRKQRPADAVFDFQHAYEWNPDTAGLKLWRIFADSWAAKTLTPKLAFRQLSKDEAIHFLAEESKATKAHRKHLDTLLDFLNVAGVVRVEGNVVQKVVASPGGSGGQDKPPQDTPPPPPGNQPPNDPVANLDPMIQGLFKKLPAAETDWSVSDRIKWLRTASNIFDLVYPSSGSSDEIQITNKEPKS